MRELISRIYIIIFAALMAVPLALTNREEGAQSVNENRPLAYRPNFHTFEGDWNLGYPADLDHYLEDRIGFRDELVAANAWLQYYVFGRMENQNKYALGDHGEFFNIEDNTLEEYQHINLFSEEELETIAGAYQTVSDALKQQGIQFYYMQCWSKETIYPEYFPTSVNQYGNISATEQVAQRIRSDTDVNFVSLIDEFRGLKNDMEVYSKWGDPVHWTPRGAVEGYRLLMRMINSLNDNKYRVLTDDDYTIPITDQGATYFGGIHHANWSEDLILKTNNEKSADPSLIGDILADKRCFHFLNDKAGNDTKVLFFGNSFVANYILDDLSQSFSDVLFIWEGMGKDLPEILKLYQPDIVISENAQRYPAFDAAVEAAEAMKDLCPPEDATDSLNSDLNKDL